MRHRDEELVVDGRQTAFAAAALADLAALRESGITHPSERLLGSPVAPAGTRSTTGP